MTARIVFQSSTLTALRSILIGIACFVGVWDVDRLISANQSPTMIDLLTCPVVPVVRIVAARMNISDILLIAILVAGNGATYAIAAHFFFCWLKQRFSSADFTNGV